MNTDLDKSVIDAFRRDYAEAEATHLGRWLMENCTPIDVRHSVGCNATDPDATYWVVGMQL